MLLFRLLSKSTFHRHLSVEGIAAIRAYILLLIPELYRCHVICLSKQPVEMLDILVAY